MPKGDHDSCGLGVTNAIAQGLPGDRDEFTCFFAGQNLLCCRVDLHTNPYITHFFNGLGEGL